MFERTLKLVRPNTGVPFDPEFTAEQLAAFKANTALKSSNPVFLSEVTTVSKSGLTRTTVQQWESEEAFTAFKTETNADLKAAWSVAAAYQEANSLTYTATGVVK